MNIKSPIIVVAGEPNSIFLEIFFKSLKKSNFKSPIILIASENLVKLQMKKLKIKKKIKILDEKNLKYKNLNNKTLNLVNIEYKTKKAFEKISSKSNIYIYNCFETAFNIIKKYKYKKFINGPINKQTFLN